MLIFGPRNAYSDKEEGRQPDRLQIGPWREVLETRHDFDAHAWPYIVHGVESQFRVSVNSPDLSKVLCHTVFLDYDGSNDHAAILESLMEIPTDHYLYRTCAIYPSKSGMRLVYRLEQPVRIPEYGPIVRGICVDLFRLTRLQMDPTTDQWTRCFRLPMVTRRDDKGSGPTWNERYFFAPLIGEATIDPDEVPQWHDRLPWDHRSRRVIEPIAGERPEVATLPQHRYGLYQRALKACRFRGYLFDGQSIPEGRRDQTLLAMTSEVVAKCFNGVIDSSIEEVYQLMRPVTDFMQPDGSESWEEKLWRMVKHVWGLETKQESDRRAKEQADLTTRDVIVNRMLEQLPKELIPTDTIERRAFIERHFCLQTSTGAYVINTRGDYSKVPLRASQLPAHFNDNLHCLVDGGFRTSKGGMLTGSTILNHFSTNVDDVQYKTGDKAGARLKLDNERKILEIVPFALRQDLLEVAELDHDCGEWLDQFTDSRSLTRWLAAALAIPRGPVASLYLNGPARVGKSMLALALAECFHCPPIPAAHAFGEFNGELMKSPVIMVDEGLPTKLTGLDPADIFRSLVTGAPVSTQHKYQLPVITEIPYRVIFAANSYDMVKRLIGRRTMDAQDRDAFRERILVIDTGRKPADLLDSKGARRYTKDWIGGPCRLARHLLKLYKMHFLESEFVPDGRLLVEGKPHPAFTLSFDLSGQGREIVDDLTTDISKLRIGKTNGVELLNALQIEGTHVWLKKRPYVKMQCARAPARAEGYSVALDRFLTGVTRQNPADLSQQWQVDLKKLLFCAIAEGHDTKLLASIQMQEAGVA